MALRIFRQVFVISTVNTTRLDAMEEFISLARESGCEGVKLRKFVADEEKRIKE